MKRRVGVTIAAAGPALLLASMGVTGSMACREKGRPDPNIRMAMSHEPEAAKESASDTGQGNPPGASSAGKGGDESTAPTVPARLDVPPEVLKAYSGIQLHWRDGSNGKEGTLEVPLQGTAKVPDSDLQVRADVFLPAFTMSAESITSTGTDASNPAARIAVLQKGQEIFTGWIFTRFPDVHPFQHPRFALRLEGGVSRKSS